MPRVLLAVLCLLLASLCQWLAGPVSSEPGTLGMAAPVPVSWEATKPAGLSASPASAGAAHGGFTAFVSRMVPTAALFQAAPELLAADRQERLLRWGQLLL